MMTALPTPVMEQVFASVPDTVYVVVEVGETGKVNVGPAPFCVPPPLLRVTLYGPVPPLTETVTLVLLPEQMVAVPLTVPLIVGQLEHDEQAGVAIETVSTRQFGLVLAVEPSQPPRHRIWID